MVTVGIAHPLVMALHGIMPHKTIKCTNGAGYYRTDIASSG
jgi:hypothetical protein